MEQTIRNMINQAVTEESYSLTENARQLYNEFKERYIEKGCLYSGKICYQFEKKDAFNELLELGIIQIRDCLVPCFELVDVERKKLIDCMGLENSWKENYSCFLQDGKFEEIERIRRNT